MTYSTKAGSSLVDHNDHRKDTLANHRQACKRCRSGYFSVWHFVVHGSSQAGLALSPRTHIRTLQYSVSLSMLNMVQLEKRVPNMLTMVYKGLCNMAWLLGTSHHSSNSVLVMHITERYKGIYRHQQLGSNHNFWPTFERGRGVRSYVLT